MADINMLHEQVGILTEHLNITVKQVRTLAEAVVTLTTRVDSLEAEVGKSFLDPQINGREQSILRRLRELEAIQDDN